MRLRSISLVLVVVLVALVATSWFTSRYPADALPRDSRTESIPAPRSAQPFVSAANAESATPKRPEFWTTKVQPIALRSRIVEPSSDFSGIAVIEKNAPRVWLLQFVGPVDDAVRAELKAVGVELLLPTVANAWHARATFAELQAARLRNTALIGYARLNAADRALPAFHEALRSTRRAVRIEAYPGADVARLSGELRRLGANVTEQTPRAVEIEVPESRDDWAVVLASLDGVYALDAARPSKGPTNESAAVDSRINTVSGAPRNLNGSGVTILVRDEGRIFGHTDFGSRVILGPDVISAVPVQHATHVAGTIGGTGVTNVAAQARGMASGATLLSYDLNGDDFQELLDARNNFGALLSNHSYGFVIGWDGAVFNNNQSQFGVYGSFARDWDTLARDSGLVIVKSVGNDRNDSGSGFPHDGTLGVDGDYYECVEPSATGKNYLVIGGAADGIQAGTPISSTVVIDASSSGPCDDGRLKPELIANADNVHSCNDSLVSGNEYSFRSGTSMSTAVASGALALLVQRYRQLAGNIETPPQHWIRALLAQTATDMGRSGPDYLHGYGMLDLETAVALLETDNLTGLRIRSAALNASVPERFYTFTSDGVTPIRATLCWTDAPGDLLAAKALVNDLDLKVLRVSDRSEALPFVLNRNQPHLPATTGVNTVDTIEQLVFMPLAAGDYIVSVRGTVLNEATNFTLVSSHPFSEDLAPVARITSSSTVGNPPLSVSFTGANSFDSDGTIIRYIWDFGDGQSAEGLQVDHTYSEGSFTARLTVIDDRGASAQAIQVIAVNNDPPTAVASASPQQGPPPLNVLFSALSSSDPDGSIVKYEWDFGDGTVGLGPTVAHTYSTPGIFFVELTVTDNGASRDTAALVVVAGEPLTVTSSNFGLNFKTPARDTFRLQTRTQLVSPEIVTVAGLTGTLYVGSGQFPFTLDERGRFKSEPLSIVLTAKSTRFTASLSRASLQTAFERSGATSRTARNEVLRVPLAIQLSNGVFVGSNGFTFTYTSKQGVSGRGRFSSK